MALPGRNAIRHADGRIQEMPGKFTAWLEPGDVLSIETPGGGGWGKEIDAMFNLIGVVIGYLKR